MVHFRYGAVPDLRPASAYTRPRKLLGALMELDAVPADVALGDHRVVQGAHRRNLLQRVSPRTPKTLDGAWFSLSPVVRRGLGAPYPSWIDLYDDWSLAPDINYAHKTIARLTYRSISGHEGTGAGLTTVNSSYMARKLAQCRPLLVANGVDTHLARAQRSGDTARRLIILGHFFEGRTDYALIEAAIASNAFEEVVISPGDKDPLISAAVSRANARDTRVRIESWISSEALPELIGARTFALLPSRVSDYTLSQDPLKLYMFLALGVPVIAPRMLWPAWLSKQHAYLVDHGVHDLPGLGDFIDETRISTDERVTFATENSWQARGLQIAERLGG